MPPPVPNLPPKTLFPDTVLFSTNSELLLKIPPPFSAVLPLTAQRSMTIALLTPQAAMPPPLFPAELLEMVQSVRFSVPFWSEMPPPFENVELLFVTTQLVSVIFSLKPEIAPPDDTV